MEKAYIILAHKCPAQLQRLIERLNDGHSVFYIHIDKKSDFVWQPSDKRIVLLPRTRTHWGGYSLVEATLAGLRAVLAAKERVERVILLSGQDYPIKDNGYIDRYLESSPFRIFLEYTTVPDHGRWSPRGGLYRLDKYFFGMKGYQRFTAKAVNFLSLFLPGLSRKIPDGLVGYGGSQWWIMDLDAVGYILDYVRENPCYRRFHRYTFAPDELFFHMILLNAKDNRISGSIENNNLRFMSWDKDHNGHPDILRRAHLQSILGSQALFARKFDPAIDTGILNLLDGCA